MYRLRFQITTVSPLLITSNVGDTNMVSTADYIPGSSILGVFANKFVQKSNSEGKEPHKNETFRPWFLEGGLVFTNAYIVSSCVNGLQETTKRNYPLPFSVQYEKGNDSPYYDLLFYENGLEQTVSEKGYGRLAGKNIYKETVKKSVNFHHQRDPETGTSKEGLIFNYESIDKDQVFEGNIIGGKSDLKEFYKLFFDGSSGNIDVYIGRSKKTQYGRARFEITSQEPEEYTGEIESDSADNGNGNNGETTALTMLSDTVIYNENGFSTTKIEQLEDILKKKINNDGLTICKSFIKTGEVESFVSVWRLRRPSEICFLAGSCFLIDGLSDDDSKKLKEIQKYGIGKRRGEGFGRVVFGWQRQDGELELHNNDEIKKNEPTASIHSMTKDIIGNIIKTYLKKEIELKALNDVREFEPESLPTGHLISRIESFLKEGKDKDQFSGFVEGLKGMASSQLEKCRNSNETLYQFLTNNNKIYEDIKIANVLNISDISLTKADELCKKIGYIVKDDSSLERELFIIYFITFFSAMRKIKKQIKPRINADERG